MSRVRLIFALHDHQPVGNFDAVFEAAYRDSYLPFLELMEEYPELPFSLHTSGPLMEWLVANRPDYVARLRAMVAAGRVEILGGGFYEPILTMIPHRDRVGQIRSYSQYLEESARPADPRRLGRRAGLGAAPRLGPGRGRHRVHRPRRLPLPAGRRRPPTTSSATT